MQIRNRKRLVFISLFILCSITACFGMKVNEIQAAQESSTAPSVVKAQLINSRDIELYWSEEVTGADAESNFSVTVDGKENEIYILTWGDYMEKGTVYYNQKTSIRLTDEISDLENLPDIKVTIGGNKIKNSAGVYLEEQTIEVDTYDAFYQQIITMDCGVKILGTKSVRKEAMVKAQEMMEIILANETVAKRMGDAGCMLGIYGEGEIAFDIPEHRYTYDEAYLYVEGFGGTQLASIKDANVLRLTTGDYTTGYTDESILVHEFGHTVQNYGLSWEQQSEWEAIYKSSVTDGGKWTNSYAGSNSSEYFATLSTIWFNVMNDTYDGQWDGVRGPINTRDELKIYDRAAYDFLSKIYASDKYLPEPWTNGSVADNYTYTENGGNDVVVTPTVTYQKIVSKASTNTEDICVEVYGAEQAEGATVDIWYDFDDTAFLGWNFEKTEAGYYKIKFYNSGYVLMPKNASKDVGTAITIGTDTGADHQLWQLKKTSGDYILIVNKYSSLALSIQGNSLTYGSLLIQSEYTEDGTDYQQWKVYNSATQEVLIPDEPVKPTDPVQPADSVKPTESVQPTKPTNSTNITQLTQSAKKKYQVRFMYNNGADMITTEVTEGTVVSKPKEPVRKGYLFKGWYRGNKIYSFHSAVTDNLTLEAKWTKVSVKKTKIVSAKVKNRNVSLTIKKIGGVNGYKITCSTKKNFKKVVKTKHIKSNKLTWKKMKKGTYYFKVQAYKLDSTGKKIYGKSRKIKKVIVK